MRSWASLTVSRMDRVRNENVRSRVGTERELVSRVDQRVLTLRWFRHESREWMSTVGQKGVDGRSKECGYGYTNIWLDEWCEDGHGHQMDDGKGCATMWER